MSFENHPTVTATVTLPEPIIIVPGYDETVYSYGFDSKFGLDRDGWSPGVRSNARARTGTFSLLADTPTRTFTDLVVGHTYTLAGYRWDGAAWVLYSQTFNASTATQTRGLNWAGSTYWDDVTLVHHVPAVVATDSASLDVSDGDLTLDSGRYPYAEASVVVPLTSEDLLAQIEPGQRVAFSASSAGSWLKTYTPWVEQRRNLANNPIPSSLTGYSGPNTASLTTDGYTQTNTSTTTPYIFSTPSNTGATLGRVYAFRAKIKAYAAPGSIFTSVLVRPHKTTGNVYYALTPAIQVPADGVEREVFFYWKATVNIPAAEAFNLSIVGNGTGLATSRYSMREVMIEDVGTETPPVDPAEYFAPVTSGEFQQTRFTGTVNASASVLETRELDAVTWVPAVGMTADLTISERKVSHDGKTITLALASDELLLSTWADVEDDPTPRTHETNLRNLVNYVLGKVLPGTALEAGSANADVTATWAGTNLIANPAGGPSATGWVAGATGGTIAAVAGGRTTNPYRLRVSNAAAGYTGGPSFSGAIRVTAGKNYTTSMWVRSNRAVTLRIGYQWGTNGTGTTPANHLGPSVTLVPNEWTFLKTSARVPANADRFIPYVYPASGSYAAASWLDFDEVMVFDTFEDLPQFNGDTPDTALYTYEWDDATTPYDSQSTRTPVVDRPRELFTWDAGVDAWTFLTPLVASAGLRLFADEQRRWYLIDPATYSVPGSFTASPDNTAEGTDTMDATDEDTGITGVVAVFSWTDQNGTTRTKKDIAGVAGKVKRIEFDSPFPGAGIAAAHLAKVQGLGRVQDVTSATDYAVRPGMGIEIDLPGTPQQAGTITRVQFELTEGLMQIGSANLEETP